MDPTILWLLGIAIAAIAAVAGWTLREVVALKVTVAEQGTHGRRDGQDIETLRTAIAAMETRICGCLSEQGKSLTIMSERLGRVEVLLGRDGT